MLNTTHSQHLKRTAWVPIACALLCAWTWSHFFTEATPALGNTKGASQSGNAEGAGQSVQTIAKELANIVTKQADAWNRGDLTEFMSAYWRDERLTFSSSGKTQRGWQATLANYQKNYPDRKTMGKLTFSDFETQELGADAMLMLGRWHLERDEPVGGNFSLVWKRIDNKWVIVHDHSSALKKEDK